MQLTASGPLRGSVRIPGDKSISHRAAMLAALASGSLELNNYAPGADCQSTLHCLRALGVTWEQSERSVLVHGRSGHFAEPSSVLDCGNSGTTLRLLTGLLAGQQGLFVLTGDASLRKRPMSRVIEPLQRMGAELTARSEHTRAPVVIQGQSLHGIHYSMPVASAQVKSALLLAALHARGRTRIEEMSSSRDHTERMLRSFHIPVESRDGSHEVAGEQFDRLRAPAEGVLSIPGDISSAAFLMAAALLVPQSQITLLDVGLNPTRTGMIDVLSRSGAHLRITNRRKWGEEPVGDIHLEHSSLRAMHVAADEIPTLIDELPVLAMLATRAQGESVFSGVGELRVKETDRLQAVVEELRSVGFSLRTRGDDLIVTGGGTPQSASVAARGDHRMAMMLLLSGLPQVPVKVDEVESISVSYPSFVDHVETLGLQAFTSPRTAHFSLIGSPVAHSRSPELFAAAFRERKMLSQYIAFDVPSADLPEAVEGLRRLGIQGFNVTTPHKQAIVPLLDIVEPSARAIGAVNAVVFRRGRAVGHNTDVQGVLGPLIQRKFPFADRTALVLGAGGAARAAGYALASQGIRRIQFANRTQEHAEALAQSMRELFPEVECRATDLSPESLEPADLLVQATSAEMQRSSQCPLPEAYPLRSSMYVFEMVYDPEETELVQRARAAGAEVILGLEMLLHQAFQAFELMTGVPAPERAMRQALTGGDG